MAIDEMLTVSLRDAQRELLWAYERYHGALWLRDPAVADEFARRTSLLADALAVAIEGLAVVNRES